MPDAKFVDREIYLVGWPTLKKRLIKGLSIIIIIYLYGNSYRKREGVLCVNLVK